MSPAFWPDLSQPSPQGTLFSSVLTLAILALVYALVQWWRGPGDHKSSIFERFVGWLRSVDGAVVRYGSWFVGTRVRRPWVRHLVMLVIFGGIALGGAFASWPLGLWVLTLGLCCVFIVFRHWSHEGDDVEREVRPEDKKIKIDGNLSTAMIGACAFVLVYAPTAFAHMQAAGYGFHIPAGAGSFTFVRYALIEALKVGAVVSYYDLFADKLHFENLGTVTDPSTAAKWAVLAFRGTLGLIILAALKRLVDTARRVADRLDLRPIDEVLTDDDVEEHKKAVAKLELLSLRGRRGAAQRLERILTELKDRKLRFDVSVRVAAANALECYGETRGETGSLLLAIDAYRKIARDEPTRVLMPLQWAMTQNKLGIALARLGERESGTARLEEAVAVCRDALQEATRERAPLFWAMTQNNLGTALSRLGVRESDTACLEEAVAAYRNALQERTHERTPLDWATTQSNLGIALATLGELEGDTGRLEEAVAAYRDALQETTRKRAPLAWAMTQNNLGIALDTLSELENSPERLEEAIAAYRDALHERTQERAPLDWAMTQSHLGTALARLGECEGDTARLEEAVAAHRAALHVYTRERMPLQWAMTQNNLGIALAKLGEGDTTRLEEAVAAYRDALQERTQERAPQDWAATQGNLGTALATLGEREGDAARLEEAVTAVQSALEVFRDGEPDARRM